MQNIFIEDIKIGSPVIDEKLSFQNGGEERRSWELLIKNLKFGDAKKDELKLLLSVLVFQALHKLNPLKFANRRAGNLKLLDAHNKPIN